MSLVSNALADALSIVAAAKDESLSYRIDDTRSWVALEGFVLDRDDVIPPVYEEDTRAEVITRTARLSGPLSPVLAENYQVRDGNGDIWAVVTIQPDQQQIAALRFSTVDNAGPNRGGAL